MKNRICWDLQLLADAGTASFRFLYRRTDLPQGLVNAVVEAMPEYKFEIK